VEVNGAQMACHGVEQGWSMVMDQQASHLK